MRKTVANCGTGLDRGRHDARKVTSTFSLDHPNKSSLYLQENKSKPNSDVWRRVQTSILFLVINIYSRIAWERSIPFLIWKYITQLQLTMLKHCGAGIKTHVQNGAPGMDPMLLVSHGARDTRWGRGSLVNKRCWGNCTSTCTRMKLGPCLIPYAEVNLKSIWASTYTLKLRNSQKKNHRGKS